MTGDLKTISREKCFVCGADTAFEIKNDATLYREAACIHCGASKRNSDTAHSIVLTFTGKEGLSLSDSLDLLRDLHIYEASASGKIHETLKGLPHYICSEFLAEVSPGLVRDGIRCEDLTRLTFADYTFDLVITQDVLEHVSDPMKAFSEIKRVLKRGGYHIFTVPLHEGRKTATRAVVNKGSIVNIMPPVYHDDRLRKEGALVYTDFGDDIIEKLDDMGIETELVPCSGWYRPAEITCVSSDDAYDSYAAARKSGDMLSFFKYNSIVFVSLNKRILSTGERCIPGADIFVSCEHLHRYALACDYVSGKTVLDIACGEGYGSYLLAARAARVVGLDISEDTISHARIKYGKRKNIEFLKGPCTEIPCPDGSFDVAVSFETIEHIEEHGKMLDELRRVLKHDGMLIISTPNKKTYTDDPQFKNKYHVKELYLSEFVGLLKSRFTHISVLGQRMTFSSYIWPLENGRGSGEFLHYSGNYSGVDPSIGAPFEALYFVAFCTVAESKRDRAAGSSLFTDKNDLLYAAGIPEKAMQLEIREKQIEAILNSRSWKLTAPLRRLGDFLAGMKRDKKTLDD